MTIHTQTDANQPATFENYSQFLKKKKKSKNNNKKNYFSFQNFYQIFIIFLLKTIAPLSTVVNQSSQKLVLHFV